MACSLGLVMSSDALLVDFLSQENTGLPRFGASHTHTTSSDTMSDHELTMDTQLNTMYSLYMTFRCNSLINIMVDKNVSWLAISPVAMMTYCF